jgi:hypothetical protein
MTGIANSHGSLEMPSFVSIFWQRSVRRGDFAVVQGGEFQCRSDLVIEMLLGKCLFVLFGESGNIRTVVGLPHVSHEEPVGTIPRTAGNEEGVMLTENRAQRAFLNSLDTSRDAEDARICCWLRWDIVSCYRSAVELSFFIPDSSEGSIHVGSTV